MSNPSRSEDNERTARFWNASHAAGSAADTFLEHPLVHAYISMRAFGRNASHLDHAIAEIARRTEPGARLLSVGCGAALKERAICRALPDRTLVGIDIAADTIARTRQEAAAEGIGNLELRVGDFNALDLNPDSFDMILGLGAIHHVEQLEQLWSAFRGALRPGGCVLAQEYVGASRFQWTPAQIGQGTEMLRTLPPEHRNGEHVEPVDLDALIAADPSEAVRSAEILSTCEASGFVVEEYRGGGCGLLQPVLMNVMHTFDPLDWQHNAVLFALFAEEQRRAAAHGIGDSYAMFIAR